MIPRRHRTIPAWIALMAMLLNAFWPLLANAKPDRVLQAHPHEAHHAAAHHGDLDHAPNGGHGAPHCSFCTVAGDRAVPLSATGAWTATPLRVEAVQFPPLPQRIYRRDSRINWQSRAPPQLFS